MSSEDEDDNDVVEGVGIMGHQDEDEVFRVGDHVLITRGGADQGEGQRGVVLRVPDGDPRCAVKLRDGAAINVIRSCFERVCPDGKDGEGNPAGCDAWGQCFVDADAAGSGDEASDEDPDFDPAQHQEAEEEPCNYADFEPATSHWGALS